MRHSATFVLVALAVAALWLLAWPLAVEQPLPYDHVKHDKIACDVCHRGSETDVHAGFPDDAVCLQCHETAPRVERADVVWRELATGREIRWMRVTRMPDHVFFSHRRHVGLAKLDCASCHGDVGRQSTPPTASLTRLDMDACQVCHRQEDVNDDCNACHR